eukprot:77653-Pleurochrysis_carterae.AAC.2
MQVIFVREEALKCVCASQIVELAEVAADVAEVEGRHRDGARRARQRPERRAVTQVGQRRRRLEVAHEVLLLGANLEAAQRRLRLVQARVETRHLRRQIAQIVEIDQIVEIAQILHLRIERDERRAAQREGSARRKESHLVKLRERRLRVEVTRREHTADVVNRQPVQNSFVQIDVVEAQRALLRDQREAQLVDGGEAG